MYQQGDPYQNLGANSNIYDNFQPLSTIYNRNISEYWNRTIHKRNTENTHKGEPVKQHNIIDVLIVSLY